MTVSTPAPRPKLLAPTSEISARIPPSPLLSARMTNRQYLIEIVTIRVQAISESTPSALCAVNCPPVACTTVCREYKGLVPRSPKTTPNALSIAHRPGGAGWRAAGAGSRVEGVAVTLTLLYCPGAG